MSPVDMQDILDRAKGSARIGDHEEAERLLKQYLAKEKDDRNARLLLGTTLAKAGKLVEAEDEFTTLLAENPRDMEALNNLAVIYRRQDKLQDALGALMEAIDIDPTRAELHYNIGNIHKQLGNLKAASMAYAKVVELNPNYVHAYNNLGNIYDQLHEWDKAFNVFRKGLALDKNNPSLHFNYGVALEANGRLEDAAAEYQAAIRSKPGWFEAMNNLGIIYFKQGQHHKAMDTFNRILKIDPFNAEARNNMGVVFSDQGRNKEAIQNFRQALEADPKYVKAVVNLERTLEDEGDFADAMIELEKLVKLAPDSVDIRNRLASLYLKVERYPEALEQVRAAREWDPENVQSVRLEGMIQRILGNDEEAQKLFEKVLEIDPGNFTFHLDLADIHFKRKEYKEAENRIMAFLTRRPNDREAKLLLGKLYAEMGNRTHAIQIFEELAKADPSDAEALAAAAALHKEAGSLEKALRTADKLVNLQGKRGTADDLSDLGKSLEFYENAVNAYSSSVREMWDRNMKLITETSDAENETAADDMSLLLGAAGMTPVMDEETEELFIEDVEAEEPEDEELLPDDEDEYPLFGEDTSLDNMAEPNAEPVPYPSVGSPPYPANAADSGMPPQSPEGAPPSPGGTPPQPQDTPSQGRPSQTGTPPSWEQPSQEQPSQTGPSQTGTPPRQNTPDRDPPPSGANPQDAPSQQPEPPDLPQPEEPPRQPEPPQSGQQPESPPPGPQPPRYPPQPQYPPPPEEPQEREIPWDAEPEEPYTVSDEGEEAIPGESWDETPEEEPAESGEALEDLFGDETPEAPGTEDEETGDDIQEAEAAEMEPDAPLPQEKLPEISDDFFDELAAPENPAPPATPESAPPGGAEKESPPRIRKDAMIGLMKYLKDLAVSLPDKNRSAFLQSDARLSMEYVIDSLEGRKGLFKEIQEKSSLYEIHQNKTPEKTGAIKPADVAGTLAFLGKLAAALPDKTLTGAITRKVDTVITGIRRAESGEKHV
jgi:tetratricopeptide (TPR) repeat protein